MKFIIFTIIFFSAIVFQGTCVVLNDIKVPSMVLIDGHDDDSITLDCEYELLSEPGSLVVKWFKDNEAVYQWIRGQDPSVFPSFKDKVDLKIDTSSNADEQYRQLTLVNPNINTTGSYKCTVQTAKETTSMEKMLQVVDISNYSLNFHQHKVQNETHLECTVDNVYPKPVLELSTDDDDDIISIISFKVNEDDNGLFNATIVAVVDEDEGDDEDDDIDAYKCTVVFTGLPLNLTTTVTSGAGAYFVTNIMFLLLLPIFLFV